MNNVQWIKLKTDMFSDEKIRLIEQMENGDSILIIWLKMLTHAGKINDDGMIYLNPGTPFSLDMLSVIYGRDKSLIQSALEVLKNFGMIDVSRDSGVCISNWEKHQNVEQLEIIREKNRERVRKHRERKRLKDGNVTETLHVTLRNAVEKNRKEKNKTHVQKKESASKTYADDCVEINLAKYLLKSIQEWNDNCKEPNIQKWCDPFRLLQSRDKQDIENIKSTLWWACEHKFWRSRILSPAKFRKQFDVLYAQMINDKGRPENNKTKVVDMHEISRRANLKGEWISAGKEANDPAFEEWAMRGGKSSEL